MRQNVLFRLVNKTGHLSVHLMAEWYLCIDRSEFDDRQRDHCSGNRRRAIRQSEIGVRGEQEPREARTASLAESLDVLPGGHEADNATIRT